MEHKAVREYREEMGRVEANARRRAGDRAGARSAGREGALGGGTYLVGMGVRDGRGREEVRTRGAPRLAGEGTERDRCERGRVTRGARIGREWPD